MSHSSYTDCRRMDFIGAESSTSWQSIVGASPWISWDWATPKSPSPRISV
jgi:hypothetical protein